MSYQDQITEQQQRLQQAYTAYRAVYLTMTPPPALLTVPDPTEYKADNQFIRGVLGIILIGSMIVSGSHTIPTFAGADPETGVVEGIQAIVGIAAFFMLEAAIVAFAYIRTQRHIQVERAEPANFQQLVTRGLGIAFAVAVLGNIDYTLRSKGFYIAEIFQVFILLGMAISAPVLAFITGDILAVYQVQDRVKQRKHVETYEQRMREVEEQNRVISREWEDGLAKAWDANKARWGGTTNVRVERPPTGQLDGTANGMLSANLSRVRSTLSNGQDIGQVDSPYGHTFTRNSLGSQQVWDHLKLHPEDANAKSRELALRLGNVSKSTVAKVQAQFKAQEQPNE